jgi:hypothetical protein
VFLSYMLCLSCSQPGDPNDTDSDEDKGEDESRRSYAQLCLPLANPQVSFCGPISAIPFTAGENKIFSIDIHAYLKKEAGQNVFSDFTIHCIMAGTPRWGNTFVPRLGRWTTVIIDARKHQYFRHHSLKLHVHVSPCCLCPLSLQASRHKFKIFLQETYHNL